MPKYRVCYRRGSFTLADNCENYGEALARALYLKAQRGVWTVRLEDMAGVLVRGNFDLEEPSHALGLGLHTGSASDDADNPEHDRCQMKLAANLFQ